MALPLPIELRLRALEAAVVGVPSTQLAAVTNPEDRATARPRKPTRKTNTAADADDDEPQATLAQRVDALAGALERAVATSPPLQQFYENYNRFAPLLAVDEKETHSHGNSISSHSMHTPHMSVSGSGARSATTAGATPTAATMPSAATPTSETPVSPASPPASASPTSPLHARDLLPLPAKVAMVLEARADIVEAERGLREIDVLNRRGVAGAGELEEITDLEPALLTASARLSDRKRELATTRARVAGLVEQYNDFTTTVSDMFVALHEQVSALEEAAARAERRRRNELAGRY